MRHQIILVLGDREHGHYLLYIFEMDYDWLKANAWRPSIFNMGQLIVVVYFKSRLEVVNVTSFYKRKKTQH